ncbi:MAG: HU family DNA-binding protein [Rickettsiales bacterium]|jgi:DNA-binding protein HU-beta|nr:HU family DNA-binding protein [Rickettsiales bacterium]
MHKIDIIKAISEQTGCLQKDASLLVDSFIEVIKGALRKGDKVTLIGFGTFSVVDTKAKTGRNPQTGKEIRIPASKKIRFSVGKNLKEEIKGLMSSKKTSTSRK